MLANFVMLAALLAASVVTENLCSVPDQSSFRSNLQPACLLQNAVFSSDLVDDATDILEVTDQDSFVKRPKSAVLVEFDALEESNTGKLLVRSASRSRRCEGYLMYLNRKIYGLEHARNVSNMKMDELIRQFISKQSGSQDACSSQLMEAKHQLNQIHEYVMDLVVQVNTTERAILALDKEMQSKIKEVEALNKWKEDELAICERKKQEYIEMYKKLSIEMKEMKQIASPGVAMDVKTGTVITAEKAVGLVQIKPHQDGKKSMEDLDFLIKGTRSAAKQYMHCMTKASAKAHSSHLQRSVVVDGSEVENVQAPPGDEDDQADIDAAANIKSGAASPEKCEEEKKVLAETYVKTYVQLSRLKDEYHTLANSTACVDNVESLYNSRKTPLQAAIDRLIKEIDKKVRALQGLRPRLESATEAESALRKHIATLTEECSALPETLSDLDKVRDAIEALNKCPGLSRVEFSIPKWIGTWVSLDLKAKEMTDEEQDKAMNAACDEAAAGTRAAEVSEISMRTVEGLPETNTAKYPLVATCPNCIGDATMDLPSKHKRICWSPGHDLECKAKSTNCASGRKAVLCVTDRKNIRQIPRLQEDEEDAPVSKNKFTKLVEVLLELAIDGHPRVIQTILARRNKLLRDFSGDQEAAVKAVMKHKEAEKSVSEIIGRFLLNILPGIGLSISVIQPIWIQLRNTCLLAAVLGYDMDLEESRAQIVSAFSHVKRAAGAQAGLTMALQMAWVAFAGPIAGSLPVSDLVAKLTEGFLSKAKAEVLAKLREGKTGSVGEDEYSQELDPEPSMKDMLAVLNEDPDGVKKHAKELFTKAKDITEDIEATEDVADYAKDLGSKSKRAAEKAKKRAKDVKSGDDLAGYAEDFGSKSKQAATKIKSIKSWSPWDS